MAYVNIHYGDGRIVRHPFEKTELVIGRDASCDVPLDDAVTSRRHARLRRDDSGQFWIEDLRSKNGTTLNDQAVTNARIREGDRIGIGACYLTIMQSPTGQIVMSDGEAETGEITTNVFQASQRIVLPQQRLEKLYELNERLTGRFNRDELLREVLDLCVELLRFERAGIAVWRGDPHPPQWVALRNLGDRAPERLTSLGDRTPDRLEAAPGEFRISRSLVNRALFNAERILVHDTGSGAFDPTASMISNHIRSAMCVPMVYHERVRGLIYGDRVTSSGGYSREDIDFFAALGRLGAMGLANVQLLEEMQHRQQVELQIHWARQIQNRLFPAEPLVRPGLRVEALNDPGQHISGDYYDFLLRDDGRVILVIADVVGKGIPASLLMANLQAAVHVTLATENDLVAAVQKLNQLICRNVSDCRFITAVFALLNPATREIQWVNAGHPPPYILRGGGRATAVPITGSLPLGIEPDFSYRLFSEPLGSEPATLFLYTDGVPEAQNSREEPFSEERLAEFLRENTDRTPEELLSRLRTTVRQFTRGQAQGDDITMLAARVGG